MKVENTNNIISIEEVNEHNKEEYGNYINSRNDISFSDYWEWREVVEKSYRLPHYCHGQVARSWVCCVLH
jgi:beta-mannanase